MKTIEERARESYPEHLKRRDIDEDNLWMPQHRGGYVYGYKDGATEQKAIMLEEASKGFEEFWQENRGALVRDDEKGGLFALERDLMAWEREAWQAATLSKQKEIEELKKDLEWLLNDYVVGNIEHSERRKEIRKKHNLESR